MSVWSYLLRNFNLYWQSVRIQRDFTHSVALPHKLLGAMSVPSAFDW